MLPCKGLFTEMRGNANFSEELSFVLGLDLNLPCKTYANVETATQFGLESGKTGFQNRDLPPL